MTFVYLGLFGDFDPAAVAEDVGLTPARSQAAHSRDPERRLPRNASMRFAQVDADPQTEVPDVEALAERVVEQLEPHLEAFLAAIAKHRAVASLQVVVYVPVSEEISTPMIAFSERVVRFVATLGASIDLDCYRC